VTEGRVDARDFDRAWVKTVRDANPEPNLDEITLGVYKALGAELLRTEQRTQEIRKIY